MIKRALLAAVILAGVGPAALAQTPLAVWVDVDGTAYLWNTTDAPISFDGIQFDSETNRLNPAEWRSIADQANEDRMLVINALGAGALTFVEVTPASGALSELSFGGGAILQPHARFAIGRPFLDGANQEATSDFFYKLAGDNTPWQGDIWVPEPSTFLLAALAGMGLLAFRRWS